MRKQIVFLNLLFSVAMWNAQATVVKGSVKSTDGKPVENVVVTDGYRFTSTNAQGEYSLDTDEAKSRFIYISTPSDYEIIASEGWNRSFFLPINPSDEGKTYDFTLTRRDQPAKKFVYLAVSDPQVTNEQELARYTNETLVDMQQTASRFKGKQEVYAMLLGDLVNDKMELFEPLRKSMASQGIVYSPVIGNHDHNQLYTALSNLEDTKNGYAEARYESFFGPYNYSFNVGDIHIIALKDIDYIKDRKYTERFGKEQLDWLKNDLSYVEPGTTVFINVHAPVFNQTDKGGGNARDAEEFRQIVKDYNVHVFAGHTHFYENNQVPLRAQHRCRLRCLVGWARQSLRCAEWLSGGRGRWSEREMALQGYGSPGRLSTSGLQAWGVQIGGRLCRRQRLGLGFRLARGMVGGRAEQRRDGTLRRRGSGLHRHARQTRRLPYPPPFPLPTFKRCQAD